MTLVVNDRYSLRRCLGGGGMGRVYLAEDLRQRGHLVALKTLVSLMESPEGPAFLRREFLVLAELAHPHLVGVHDFDHVRHVLGEPLRNEPSEALATGLPFFTREFVAGIPLLEAATQYPLEALLRILVQLTSAMVYLHRQDLLHRDVKPDNVLVADGDEEGRPPRAKVLDFGLAAYAGEVTRAAGNIRYLAPELIHGAKPDARAELYSLGLVFYEVLAGRPPFDGETAVELARAHANLEPPALPDKVPPKVRELVRDLLAKRPEDRPRIQEVAAALERTLSPNEPHRAIMGVLGTTRLVGREREIKLIDKVVADLASRQASSTEKHLATIVLTGPPGIGKTRLAQALRYRAQVNGFRFLCATCKPDSDAFSAGRALLRPLIQERPDLITPEREVLRLLLSDRTLSRSDHQAADLTPRRAMVRIFDAARTLFEAASRERRLIIVMEDLHWADPESLELFRHLQRHLSPGMVLLVGTSWPPGLSQGPVDEVLAELPLATGEAGWYELEGLDARAARTLLRYGIGLEEPPPELVNRLLEQTEGNPLFIEEILKLSQGAESLANLLEHEHLPRAVGDAFRAQILALSPQSLTALKGLAIWGTPGTSLDVSQVTLQERIECLEGLEDAADGQLVRETSGGYWFWHNVMVQILTGLMTEEEKVSFHRRAGQRREASGDVHEPERIGRLVTHYTIAGETAKALGYALSGARLAEKHFMARRAVELYEAARDLSMEVMGLSYGGMAGLVEVRERLAHLYAWTGSYDAAEAEARILLEDPGVHRDVTARIRVRSLLGDIATRKGDLDAALEHFYSVLEWCDDADAAAEALSRIAEVYLRQGNTEEAERACQLALERLGDLPAPARRAAIAYHLGRCAQQNSDYPVALEQFNRARSLYVLARYKPGIAAAIHATGQVYHYQDQYGNAREAFLDALELQEQLGDVESVANTLERLALSTWGLLDTQAAIAYCQRSLKEWRRLGNAQGEARSLSTLGLIHHSSGAYGEALKCAESAIELQRKADDQTGLLVSYQNLGILYYEVGALREARVATETALEIAGEWGSKLRKMRCYHILGVVASVRGDNKSAQRFLESAVKIANEVGNRERLADILCAMAEHALRKEDVAEARAHADRARTLVASLGRNLIRTQVEMVAAQVALEEPDADLKSVMEKLEQVDPQAGEHSSPDLMWQLWDVKGRVALKVGRPREACRLLTRSMEVIQTCYRQIPDRLRPVYVADARRQGVRKALGQAINVVQNTNRVKQTGRKMVLLEEKDK